jgi:hypothetical protein
VKFSPPLSELVFKGETSKIQHSARHHAGGEQPYESSVIVQFVLFVSGT